MDVLNNPGPTPITAIVESKSYVQQSGVDLPIVGQNKFASVDAARGLAAGMVLIHHVTIFFPGACATLVGRDTIAAQALHFISDLNTEAVMLFFVISGFCIRSSSQKTNFGHSADFLHYGRRRFARIVPLYWFALAFTGAVGAVLALTADHAFSLENLLGNLSFLQSSDSARGTWFVPYGLNGPLWSISYEVFYYVLFPFALLTEHRLGIRSPVMSLLLAFVFSLVALIAYNLAPNPIMLFATYYCVWRLGVCAFDVLRDPGEFRAALAVTIGAIVVFSAIIAWHASASLSNMRSGAIIAVLWIAAQAWPNAHAFASLIPVSKVIGGLARLGAISYGLYLLHHPILRLVSSFAGDTVRALALSIATALIVAALAEAGGLHLKYLILRPRAVSAQT
jgi:peptidoglycan/LPS O-acetylase OafA/YrhL